ncbi:hypothetical protein DTO013E5_2880 [Penicillium roqueforti]|uniref:Uncharacterized protein n=1 Tax=Penicillium roqueforti (strain FM164) TaxID=1365484 RepID=W6QK52_PENRF|nr:uncharacterized protein LCP9604111_3651 [Penicillium roqueforti]CDM36760.1 unnamed protein product [Penicillium roqueforti FM164]KAF9250135.1 hypothetical protein LCP9604111_3651 [Penicillium roqueforti]KAI1831459.1 hypothetical protein CBS147337_7615 [Penicillium roqueforti]KAI2679586.1 hypothetical protein CBS147355_4068 [Penicillium roqueforti]KAI2684466.1 hypothetical protein LCP963914a_5198 [Penicillium roqueforti]
MPVRAMYDDEYSSHDSEFETDVSTRRTGVRTHIRERSVSRQRRPEIITREYITPPIQTRVPRSASISSRHREYELPVAPTAPAVMIFNEQGLKSESRSENKPQSRRVQQRFSDKYNVNRFEDEEEEDIVQVPVAPRRRERAVSNVSRTASPLQRDHELAMNQHMMERNDIRQDIGQQLLERNDLRQDMDLWKHQQEIERLQRELQKSRRAEQERSHEHSRSREQIIVNQPDPHDSRMLREELEYEEEISDRLRKLQHFERKHLSEEEERKAGERYQLKQLAAEKRAAAEQEEVRRKLMEERLKEIACAQDEKIQREKLVREEKWKELARLTEEQEARDKLVREEKWKRLAREKEEEEEREKLIQQIRDEDMRKAREAEEKRKKELAVKAAAVEEWKLEQERRKQREAEEAMQKAREFREHLRSIGYSEEEIDGIINKKKHDEKKKEEKKEKEEDRREERREERRDERKEEKITWIKVHRKHLMPETLIAYGLPWDWDEHDNNYIIIKKWIDDDFQEQLFAHTRRLRETKMLTETSHSMTELKVNDRRKDKMFLVRKKSPSGRVRVFA